MNDAGRISISTLLTVIGLVFAGLRFFIRYSKTRTPSRGPQPWIFYLGDGLCLLAACLTISYCAMYIWQQSTVYRTFPSDGFDVSKIPNNLEEIKRGLTWGWIMAMIYSSAVWSVKVRNCDHQWDLADLNFDRDHLSAFTTALRRD